MRLKVKYFSVYQDLLGKEEEECEVEEGVTVFDVFESILRKHPMRKRFLDATLFAVNQEFVSTERKLENGDVVAFIPPVAC